MKFQLKDFNHKKSYQKKSIRQHITPKKTNNLHSTQTGFTLFEVMIALAILAVTAVSVYQASQYYRTQLDRHNKRIDAQFVLANQLTDIQLQDPKSNFTKTLTVTEFGKSFKVSWQQETTTQSSQVKAIQVSVSQIDHNVVTGVLAKGSVFLFAPPDDLKPLPKSTLQSTSPQDSTNQSSTTNPASSTPPSNNPSLSN